MNTWLPRTVVLVCVLCCSNVLGDMPGSLVLQTDSRSFGGITDIAWSNDGHYLLTGGSNGVAKLWNIEAGGIAREYAFGAIRLAAVAFGPDDQQIAMVDKYGLTRIVDLRTGESLHEFVPHVENAPPSQEFRDLRFDAAGVRLLTQSRLDRQPQHEIDRENPPEFVSELTLWDAMSGEPIQTFHASLKPYWEDIAAAAFSADGSQLVMCSSHRTFLWDVGQEEPDHVIPSDKGHSARCMAITPDGSRCFIDTGDADSDYAVRMIDVTTGKQKRRFGDHGDHVPSVLVSPDGRRMLSLSEDNVARLWGIDSGKLIRVNVCKDRPQYAAFRPDGKAIAIVTSRGEILIWDLTVPHRFGTGETAEEIQRALDGFTHSGYDNKYVWRSRHEEVRFPFSSIQSARSLVLSSDGTTLGVRSEEGTFLWATGSQPRQVATFHGTDLRGRLPYAFIFSPDGSRAVVMPRTVWDVGRGRAGRVLEAPHVAIQTGMGCHTNADGMRQQPDGTWKWSGWSSSSTSFGYHGRLSCISPTGWAMTHAGSQIAYATYLSEYAILLWDGETGRISHVLPGQSDRCAITFSTDEKSLIAADEKQCAIWDVESGEKTAVWPLDNGKGCGAIACHPDGRRVTTGLEEGRIDVVDLDNGKAHTLAKGLEGRVESLAYSSDLTELAACVRCAGGCRVLHFDASSGELRKTLLTHEGRGWPACVTYLDDRTVFCKFGTEKWLVVDRETGVVEREGTPAVFPRVETPGSEQEREDEPFLVTLNAAHYAEPDSNGDVQLRNAMSGKTLKTFSAYRRAAGQLTLSDDGSHLLNRNDNHISIFDLQTGQCVFEKLVKPRPRNWSQFNRSVMAGISHDGGLVAVEEEVGTFVVYDTNTGQEYRRMATPPDNETERALDAETKKYGSSESMRSSLRLEPPAGAYVRSVVFNHDASRLGVGMGNGFARFYDVTTGELIKELNCTGQPVDETPVDESITSPAAQSQRRFEGVTHIVFSADGQRIFTVVPSKFGYYLFDNDPGDVVQMWDGTSFEPLRSLSSDTLRLRYEVFPNSDGSLLLGRVEVDDNKWVVSLVDTETGEQARSFETGTFASDFACVGGDRFIYIEAGAARATIHSVATGEPVATIQGYGNGDWAVIASDGRFDVSSNDAMERFGFLKDGSLEPIAASQLRDALHRPGLLPQLLRE